jgi:transcription elongation factor Elf1
MATHDDIRRALEKKGFKLDDTLPHECPKCKERSVEVWILRGKGGGRDIDVCGNCGLSMSWRVRPLQEREQDTAFEIKSFLGMS